MKAKKKSLLQRTGNSLFYCSVMEGVVNSWNFPEMLWKWTWSKVLSPSSGWYKGLKISYKLEILQKYVDSISKVNQRLCNEGPAEGFKCIYQAEGHSKKWHSMFIWRKEKFWLLDDAGRKNFFFLILFAGSAVHINLTIQHFYSETELSLVGTLPYVIHQEVMQT